MIEELNRFQRFTVAMLKALYQKQTLINCPKCKGTDKSRPVCYGFGAIPSLEFAEE